jgi:hypothetical protein
MTAISPIDQRQAHSRIHRVREGVTRAAAFVTRQARAVRPEQVLWVVLMAVFLSFVLVLMLEPSAAGRGGR